MKCITLLDDKDANFHLDRKKYIYFPTHNAGRSSRSLHGVTTRVKAQVAQARNMSIGDKQHCCVTFKYKDLYGRKPIVSVTNENERISIKKQLTFYLKCVLRGPRADLWPFYGFLCKPFSLPWTTEERRNTHFK